MPKRIDDGYAVEDIFDLEGPGQRVKRGMLVWGRAHQLQGTTTGGTRYCGCEECPGVLIGVRWPDGGMTWPCTEGMSYEGGSYSEDCAYEIL